jgi:hypothetical protein
MIGLVQLLPPKTRLENVKSNAVKMTFFIDWLLFMALRKRIFMKSATEFRQCFQ